MSDREEYFQDFLQMRGVETPCHRCSGLGVRGYGDTSTWRGGIGGQIMSSGICDHCWGSGDENNHWTDLRKIDELVAENEKLRRWVEDLQSGMFVNCVYCGHRYGPNSDTPVSMADVLKQHVENCSDHPMSKLKAENKVLQAAAAGANSLLLEVQNECIELRKKIERMEYNAGLVLGMSGDNEVDPTEKDPVFSLTTMFIYYEEMCGEAKELLEKMLQAKSEKEFCEVREEVIEFLYGDKSKR